MDARSGWDLTSGGDLAVTVPRDGRPVLGSTTVPAAPTDAELRRLGSVVGPGDVIAGKYVVERVLGRGGMGQVVGARHAELGTMVAVKLLLPKALGEHTVERFRREALAMACLRSEHAVRIHDVGDANGTPYILMEYLEGNDLADELRRRGPLPADEAARYVLQACDVLAEAHDLGIVHRDLKPGNLFLAQKPSGERSIRVLDFGLAKRVASAELPHGVAEGAPLANPPDKLTVAGTTPGTPHFMAPEQVSSGEMGPHTDVWGIGAALYALLTARPPFTGPNGALVCGAVCTQSPIPPREHNPQIPVEIEAVVLRCLEKSPIRRYGSVRKLAEALEEAVVSAYGSAALEAPRPPRTTTPPRARPASAPSAPEAGTTEATHAPGRPAAAEATDAPSAPGHRPRRGRRAAFALMWLVAGAIAAALLTSLR